MMKKNKKINYKYMTWDGQIFDSVKEGLNYDVKAFNEVCDEIIFFHYGMFDSFSAIPENEYDAMIENLRIYHTDNITALLFHLIGAPVFYCHTERAAQIVSGLLNVLLHDKIKGIQKGFMFFDEDVMDFISLEKLPSKTIASPAFNGLMDTMNHFIKENL